MNLKLILSTVILCAVSILSAQTVLIGYDTKTGTIVPSNTNMQTQSYPVFNFQIPAGYTDFELKASITNFEGPNGTDADEPLDHLGNEVVFYYNSCFPYIGTTGAAPYQKFDITHTYVYFSASDVVKYINSSTQNVQAPANWDSRRYIYQIKSTAVLQTNQTSYDIASYLATNAKVGGVLMICAFADNTFTDITPTNIQLIWTIRFFNRAGGEMDSNGKPIYRPITPTNWVGKQFLNRPKLD